MKKTLILLLFAILKEFPLFFLNFRYSRKIAAI
ncbi:hypothetical protein Barb6_03044 [Bacteroidales bacterium Barb6]|nr:hypothetical protein Barb6_03044 [Bacteroidales bacterium Barb6]